jgi:hypothetical protein
MKPAGTSFAFWRRLRASGQNSPTLGEPPALAGWWEPLTSRLRYL